MRLCLISAYPQESHAEEALRQEMLWLQTGALALQRQGHTVTWISTAPPVWHTAVLAAPELLPPTCRYVIPCQARRWEQVPLLVVEEQVWRQPDLHTRLFTFLGLLHQALQWDVVHVWGLWSVIYLSVYTARFLQRPIVVSYGSLALRDGPQQPFTWAWVAQQPLQAVVLRMEDQQALMQQSALPEERIQLLNPPLQDTAARWLAISRQATACLLHADAARQHRGD